LDIIQCKDNKTNYAPGKVNIWDKHSVM